MAVISAGCIQVVIKLVFDNTTETVFGLKTQLLNLLCRSQQNGHFGWPEPSGIEADGYLAFACKHGDALISSLELDLAIQYHAVDLGLLKVQAEVLGLI
jgi:hypothetical protein